MFMKYVIHYSEIGLKGKNRSMFEDKLAFNVKTALKKRGLKIRGIEKDSGRIVCEVKGNEKKVEKSLKKIFGIKYFSLAEESKRNVNDVIKRCSEIMENMKKEGKGELALITKRADKTFPLTSIELNKKIGKVANRLGLKINFSNKENVLYIEITNKKVYIYRKKIIGLAGLPVSSSGKVLSMFSGGIDSPVASWLMMKRGCKVDFLHFHLFRKGKEVMKYKIKNIIKTLNEYQNHSKLFLIPYHNFQILTLDRIPHKLDLIIFKNFMFRVGEKIAKSYGYKTLVTGDSVGQVASQTLSNIVASDYGLTIPILRPLVGYDKEEIVELAKTIGTFNESVKDYKDCCSIVSRKPATAVSIEKIKDVFSKLDINKIIEKSLKELEIIEFE